MGLVYFLLVRQNTREPHKILKYSKTSRDIHNAELVGVSSDIKGQFYFNRISLASTELILAL